MAGHASQFVSQAVGEPRTTDGTINWDLSTDVSKNLSVPQRIHRLDRATAGAPILGLSTKLGGPRVVKNVVFYALRNRRLRDYIATTSATFTATATTIAFAQGNMDLLQAGYHIINLNTREIMYCKSKSTTTLTVDRGIGTVGGKAQDTSADMFMILGYSGAEGDSKFFGLSKFPEVLMYYVGELQDSYSITQFAYDAAMLPGAESPQAKERTDHFENMKMVYEKRAIFDQKSKRQRSTDKKTVYTPGGLDSMATENEYDMEGDVTEAKLQAWGEQLSRFGPPRRTVFCSPKFLRKVNIALSGQQQQNTQVMKRAGLNIRSYDAAGLILDFTRHPLFYDDASTADDALSGYAYACDMADFQPVTMRGRMTGWFRWQLNVQTPGDRLHQDQLYTNYGWQITMVEHYGRAMNVGS